MDTIRSRRAAVIWLASLVPAWPVLVHAADLPEQAHSAPQLTIGGFTDINFSVADRERAGSTKGFSEGQLALHFTSVLTPQVSFFGEITLTAPASGSFGVAVERSIIKFDYSDALKLSFGRYHTPISWWNTAFHHGQWLQTTVSRPEMIKFGGKFLPVHFLGGLAEGALSAAGLNFHYQAGLGNGRGANVSGANDAGDSNNSRAWMAGLHVRPDALYDLQVGASYYADTVTVTLPAPGGEFDEGIAAAHIVWHGESPEFIAEFAHVEHRNEMTGAKFSHDGYYIQAGWRLPLWNARWKPYARYERLRVDESDPLFLSQTATPVPEVPNRELTTAGIRYDFNDFAAIKGEYRRDQPGTQGYPNANALHLQISLAF